MVKLDLGAGSIIEEGWTAVDKRVRDTGCQPCNLGEAPWPWDDDSIDEARAIHLVQYLHPCERVTFANELWRILKVGSQCKIVVPHWCSNRAYGDLDAVWPPVSEYWILYLNRKWRLKHHPTWDISECRYGYCCNFHCVPAYTGSSDLSIRDQKYAEFALKNYKEAAVDFLITLTKHSLDSPA